MLRAWVSHMQASELSADPRISADPKAFFRVLFWPSADAKSLTKNCLPLRFIVYWGNKQIEAKSGVLS